MSVTVIAFRSCSGISVRKLALIYNPKGVKLFPPKKEILNGLFY